MGPIYSKLKPFRENKRIALALTTWPHIIFLLPPEVFSEQRSGNSAFKKKGKTQNFRRFMDMI